MDMRIHLLNTLCDEELFVLATGIHFCKAGDPAY